MRLLIILLLILINSRVNAQEMIWFQKYTPEADERLTLPLISEVENDIFKIELIRRMDGKDIFGGNKLLVSRINKDNGDIIWSKVSNLSRPVEAISGIKKINEAEYMLYGNITNTLLFYCKFNKTGELLSEKYMENDPVGLGAIFSFIVTSENDFVTTFRDISNKQGLVCVFNNNFEITDSLRISFTIEDSTITYPVFSFVVHSQTNDGGFLFSYYQVYPFLNNYLIRTDKKLAIQWNKEYNALLLPGYDWDKFIFRFIIENKDGSYLAIMNNIQAESDSTIAVIKFDSIGNQIATNFYGGKFYEIDEPLIFTMSAVDLQRDIYGNFIIGCSFKFPTIIKTNDSGGLLWENTYNLPDSNLRYGWGKIFNYDGNKIALSISDIELFVDDIGNKYWKPVNSYISLIKDKSTFIDDDIHEEKDCFVFPNPNEGKMNLYVESKLIGNLKVVIFDIQGNFVNVSNFEKKEFSQKIELDLINLSNGKYHYVIYTSGKKIGFGKFNVIK